MKELVNKSQLTDAHHTKQLVVPAIDALKKITPHAVGSVEAHEKILAFGAWLQEFVVKAEAVIDKAQRQFEVRPQRIINAAACRLLEIPECIIRENAAATSKAEAHARKVEEFKKQKFNQIEIDAISPYPEADILAHAETVACLEAEQKNLKLFIADAPRFDVSLLKDAQLSAFLQHHRTTEQAL